ncbi:hypothetical protein EG68_00323 [Paragonimus skrjabini miyazakii]|uniref:Uncharacterized protein n=1 Tax=Paragonimus skrjabini miyazakii TaxID=59628 RepID=A0A8S9Z9K9_9TREM|nr:hypothetical protein EG68_00323 [Paragonimus skrjabini miyazakii]
MDHLRSSLNRLRQRLPELIPHAPPRIRHYGDLPYFHPCWLGKRESSSGEQTDPLGSQMFHSVRSSLPRESIGNRSQDIPLTNYRWLLNKKFTCIFMWFGVICFIVGVIALQIARFFRHKRQDILSTGVGCLSASLCLLTISICSFLHAHLIIYDWDVEAGRTGLSTQTGEQTLSMTDGTVQSSVMSKSQSTSGGHLHIAADR